MSDPTTRPEQVISRRLLLGGAGAAAAVALGVASTQPAAADPTPLGATAGTLPPVAPLPPGAPARRAFAPDEQVYAPYLVILPDMTNDIVVDDPATLGYMAGGWWRTPSAPYNARVQEHIYTLSWFHANRRSWNPYAGDSALLGRLDAAIGHQLSLQHPDGSWPEYNIDEHSKAATGFGLGYLSKTLAELRKIKALTARHPAMLKAIMGGVDWFLDKQNAIWASPIQLANQNTSGLAAASYALQQDPDRARSKLLADRVEFLSENGQSPAGFFYEPYGMDIGYNFEVMLPELAEIYLITRNRTVVQMADKFADWFGYNIVREPDGSGYLNYLAMSARTSTPHYDEVVADPDKISLASWFIPKVPALAPFFTTTVDRAATRRQWARDKAPVAGLAKQDTSPRFLAHAVYGQNLPTPGAKRQAIARLPYLHREEFVEFRRDEGTDQTYLYVRRPEFYLGAFFGTRPTTMTRAGLGFLWHPEAGMIVLSGQDDVSLWATLLPNGNADGHASLDATYSIAGHAVAARSCSPHDAPVTVNYQIPDGRVLTELTMTRNTVTRSVKCTATGTEQIPLVLQPNDTVRFADGTPAGYGASASATTTGLTVRRGRVTMSIDWASTRAAHITSTTTSFLRDGRRRRHVLQVPHDGTLTTTITLR